MDFQSHYPPLYVQCLSSDAFVPKRAHPTDSGLDVFTPYSFSINPGKSVLIPLGLRFKIPIGWDLTVYNKSGISVKKSLVKGAELIDSGYRNSVHINLFNLGDLEASFNKGDKIAQLVMREVWLGELIEVDEISTETDRGLGGFGSSGDR